MPPSMPPSMPPIAVPMPGRMAVPSAAPPSVPAPPPILPLAKSVPAVNSDPMPGMTEFDIVPPSKPAPPPPEPINPPSSNAPLASTASAVLPNRYDPRPV